jgi:hypothetical protein
LGLGVTGRGEGFRVRNLHRARRLDGTVEHADPFGRVEARDDLAHLVRVGVRIGVGVRARVVRVRVRVS